MILTDKDILNELDKNPSFIKPFDSARLQSATYDVSISSKLTTMPSVSDVIRLNNGNSLDAAYSAIDLSGEGYILKPGQLVFGTLKERISLPDDVVAQVLPRTGFTRIGLLVHDQFCNPSYEGNLSIAIQNASQNNILIAEDLVIAQIMFIKLQSKPEANNLYKNKVNSAYQGEAVFTGSVFSQDELSPSARALYDRVVASLKD